MESQLYSTINTIGSYSPLPNLMKYTVQNYPQFDLGIPDQYRVDIWQQDFHRDVKHGTVPQLSSSGSCSTTPPGRRTRPADQADNDLAVGRVVDIISHSSVWEDSAIFIEEDDAQDGVDHVDGHRSPGYVISPYVTQQVNSDGTGAGVNADSTFYTQVNMTRTIEQILGLKPMNQNDLVASPMTTLFIDNPPLNNFLPWAHVPNEVPLCYGVRTTPPSNISPGINTCSSGTTASLQDSPKAKALRAGWLKMKAKVFAGNITFPTPKTRTPSATSTGTRPLDLRSPSLARRRFARRATLRRRLHSPRPTTTTKLPPGCKALSPVAGERAFFAIGRLSMGDLPQKGRRPPFGRPE